MSTQILARSIHVAVRGSAKIRTGLRSVAPKYQSTLTDSSSTAATKNWGRPVAWTVASALATASAVGTSYLVNTTSLDAFQTLPLGPVVIRDSSSGFAEPEDTSLVEEPDTGIAFPRVFERKHLLGLGVRKKYQFLNIYALGLYVNQKDFKGIKKEEERLQALLDPHNHRIIRIVMNRTLTMETVISGLMDALEPRMHGKDSFALEKFSKLRDFPSLNKGEEIILTIQGDSIECKCANGGTNIVCSEVFTKAVCDVYFGSDPVSPEAKESVLAGMNDI